MTQDELINQLLRNHPNAINIVVQQMGEAEASPSVLKRLIDEKGDIFFDVFRNVAGMVGFGGNWKWEKIGDILKGVHDVAGAVLENTGDGEGDASGNTQGVTGPKKQKKPVNLIAVGLGAIGVLILIFILVKWLK